MKNTATLIILVFIIQTLTYSQSCLPEGVTFSNQTEIDNFQTNNPDCTEIEGDVIISGEDIKNLNGLNVLTSINGKFNIEYNDSLSCLSGLESLTHIGGRFVIEFNNDLTNLIGLSALSYIGGDFELRRNAALVNTAGLNSLISIGETFTVYKNNNLVDFSGLNSLVEIGGYLYVYFNSSLLSMLGLDNILSVGGIIIYNNSILPTLSGLNSINTVQEDIYIYYNDSLMNINSLISITSINGKLWVHDNPSLNSLEGLDNIDANSITSLYIVNNLSLSECEVKSVCSYLSNNQFATITNNSTGCNSTEEVITACEQLSVDESYYNNLIEIFPNPAKKEINVLIKNELVIKEISIYNQLGQTVLNENEITDKIDISTLNRGIYIIELISNKLKIRKKLIIE